MKQFSFLFKLNSGAGPGDAPTIAIYQMRLLKFILKDRFLSAALLLLSGMIGVGTMVFFQKTLLIDSTEYFFEQKIEKEIQGSWRLANVAGLESLADSTPFNLHEHAIMNNIIYSNGTIIVKDPQYSDAHALNYKAVADLLLEENTATGTVTEKKVSISGNTMVQIVSISRTKSDNISKSEHEIVLTYSKD